MEELPLELKIMIAQHLGPFDILKIFSLNKQYREIILEKNIIFKIILKYLNTHFESLYDPYKRDIIVRKYKNLLYISRLYNYRNDNHSKIYTNSLMHAIHYRLVSNTYCNYYIQLRWINICNSLENPFLDKIISKYSKKIEIAEKERRDKEKRFFKPVCF